MQIILDEVKKEGVLVKKNGKEVARYSYKNILDDSYTFEDFKTELDSFNKTLSMQKEFDNVKDLYNSINIHAWF